MRNNITHMHMSGAYPDAFTDETFFCIEEQLGYDYTMGIENHQSLYFIFDATILRRIETMVLDSMFLKSIIYWFSFPLLVNDNLVKMLLEILVNLKFRYFVVPVY